MKKRIIFGLLAITMVLLAGSGLVAQEYDDSDGYPHVVSTSPRNKQNNVPLKTSITIRFSEEMDQSSISTDTFYLRESQGSYVNGLIQGTARSASFIPFSPLQSLQNYVVTVSGDVRAETGESVGRDYKWQFQTKMSQ